MDSNALGPRTHALLDGLGDTAAAVAARASPGAVALSLNGESYRKRPAGLVYRLRAAHDLRAQVALENSSSENSSSASLVWTSSLMSAAK